MPELLIELFSEEIPARMQSGAADTLARLVNEALGTIGPSGVQTFAGPRRIALAAKVSDGVAATTISERGPRASAPPQALEGFLRKHGATRADVTEQNGHFVLNRTVPATSAAELVAAAMPGLLRRFPWPKSMRWGRDSSFTWVRPLRRILCLLDGAVVPFSLADGADDGHGLVSGDQTEGHRFHAPGTFAVAGLDAWREGLLARFVVPEAAERRRRIADGVDRLAAAEGLRVVPDDGLLDEVAGLCEWPVPLLGRIDDAFMDLPPEVMQVSMRVNQRYFALRTADGAAASRFAFAANIEALDGGAAIVAGNERVLRARFSDARHFWDLDRKVPLVDRLPALDGITFHAKLGTQGARVARIEALARHLAPLVGADPDLAARAARLCKADLVTGMVGEFPELQGVMGGYYAAHDNEDPAVATAIREHYAPRGPADPVSAAPVSMAVALADKLDQLTAFFSVGEAPTGSGDPYALRRAALGVIRIVRSSAVRIDLIPALELALKQARASAATAQMAKDAEWEKLAREQGQSSGGLSARAYGYSLKRVPGRLEPVDTVALDLLDFIADRLRIQLRAEGARHDVLSAVFAAGADDDLLRLLARTEAVSAFLATPDGADLLAGARRAANIVRIEDKKDGPHAGPIDPALLAEPAEQALAAALDAAETTVRTALVAERDADAMGALASLRPKLDTFFDDVTVNAADPALRRNRLRLLSRLGATVATVADLSRIEG